MVVDNLLTCEELTNICNTMDVNIVSCNSISTNISLVDILYNDFINLAKKNNSDLFYINLMFDHSEIELLDPTALAMLPSDLVDDIKSNNGHVMKAKLAYIKDGLVFSTQFIDEDLVTLDEEVKEAYKQLDNIINEMNRKTLKMQLLQDNNFIIQTSQTKRAMYVKENYTELLNESKLLGSELTYFLDSIYSELKNRNK